MNFEHAFRVAAANCRPIAEIYHTWIDGSIHRGLREIDPIWRKLFVVSAQVRRRESDFFPEIFTAHDRAEDGVFASQHLGSLCQIACFDSMTDCCAAYRFAVPKCDSFNSNYMEVELRPQFSKKGEVAASVFSERPLVSGADFTQR